MDNKDTKFLTVGDSKQFLALLMPCQKRLLAYILCHVPNRSNAEDIFQEVIATLLSKFKEYREGTDFFKWAVTVARFKILSFHRDNQRTRLVFGEDDMHWVQDEAIENLHVLQDESDTLKKCMSKLTDRHRRFIDLRYYRDMTYRQIAAQFNISMQSTYRTLARIQVALLKCMRTISQSTPEKQL